ncbi:MAG: radical SAM protein [Armatimonadetes bacterium]|nr:radical SAM protein [Armatimonadota bacterium]
MIVDTTAETALPMVPPRQRVREERVGGQAFDPGTGEVTSLTEDELQARRRAAADDHTLRYFATRSWTSGELPEGCLSTPNRIYLEVTGRCNLSCVMCYREGDDGGEFSTEELTDLIGRLAATGVHEIRFTGGEPTVRDDLPALIDAALGHGLYTSLGTNGVWRDGLAEELLARPIGRTLVSLDGPEEINDALRGAGAFARTTGTLDRLVAAGRKVRVNTVITPRVLDVLPDFARQLADRGVRHLSLIAPRPTGRGAGEAFSTDRPGAADMARVSRMLPDLQGQTGVQVEFQYGADTGATAGQASDPVIRKVLCCPAGREAAFISPAGWLHACGCSPGGSADATARASFAAGNVRGLSARALHALWLGAPAWGVFRDLRRSKHSACFACARYGNGCFGSCPVHAYLASGSFDGPDPLCPLAGC